MSDETVDGTCPAKSLQRENFCCLETNKKNVEIPEKLKVSEKRFSFVEPNGRTGKFGHIGVKNFCSSRQMSSSPRFLSFVAI